MFGGERGITRAARSPCGPPSPGDDVLRCLRQLRRTDYWKSRVRIVHPGQQTKKAPRGDLLCLAEREGFEPSMEFPPYTLSRGAPSATRPSLQYFPRGAPMVLRTMPGCAITRDCVPRPFGAAVAMRRRSATAFGCLVSHSAISPILSTWRTNGPAEHAEARDYPGQSPMRTTRESHQANVCFCGTALDARFQLRRRTTSGVSQLSAESPFSRLIRS